MCVCGLSGDLLAEIEYSIYNYVFLSLKPPENKNSHVFFTLEYIFYIYDESAIYLQWPSTNKPNTHSVYI